MKKLFWIVLFVLCFAASVLIGVASAEDADQVECVEVVLPETEDCPTMTTPSESGYARGGVGVMCSLDNVIVVAEYKNPRVAIEVLYRGETEPRICDTLCVVEDEDYLCVKVLGGLSFEDIEKVLVRVFSGFDLVYKEWYAVDLSSGEPMLESIHEGPVVTPTEPTTTTEFTVETEELCIEPYCSEGFITVNVHGGFFPAASITVRYEWDDTLRYWDFASGAYYEDFCTAYTEFGLCVEHLAEVQIHAWDGFGQNVIVQYTVVKDDMGLALRETGEGRWTE